MSENPGPFPTNQQYATHHDWTMAETFAEDNRAHGNLAHGSLYLEESLAEDNQAHGNLERGNLAYRNLAHRNLAHGSLAHGSLAHGNLTHGSLYGVESLTVPASPFSNNQLPIARYDALPPVVYICYQVTSNGNASVF